MQTIIFDVDDVLVNDAFFGVVKEFCKERLNRDITKEDVGKEYYYEKAIFEDNDKIIQEFYDYFLTKDMYDYGVIEKGAVELLEELSKTHNVLIMTCATLKGREKHSGVLFKNKFDMLCKTFPFLDPANFIIGANKSIARANYMVDDRVDNLSGDISVKMLYSAPHNMDISDKELYDKGIIRVSSMEEVRKIIYGDFRDVFEIKKLIERFVPLIWNGMSLRELNISLNKFSKGYNIEVCTDINEDPGMTSSIGFDIVKFKEFMSSILREEVTHSW